MKTFWYKSLQLFNENSEAMREYWEVSGAWCRQSSETVANFPSVNENFPYKLLQLRLLVRGNAWVVSGDWWVGSSNVDPLGISATAELASNTEADTNALDTNVARGFIIYTTDICKRMKTVSTSKNMSDTGSHKKVTVFIKCLGTVVEVRSHIENIYLLD